MPIQKTCGFRWIPRPPSKLAPLPEAEKAESPRKPVITIFIPKLPSLLWAFSCPRLPELFLYAVTSRVTSDCLMDRLVDWWETTKERFSHIQTLVINLDNGPECHSHRTQFMQRLVEFVQKYQITIRLAYYPPYHSKYNPVERCWSTLEHHWNGSLLDSVDAVVQFARTMTWKSNHPVVELVTTTYQTGVKLTAKAMKVVEAQLQRLPALGKWFIDLIPSPSAGRDD